ncbi:cell division protein ZapA [Acetivibrio mesophilus]|uniref:Cell division protein ZapA n=1 Tax=Acetivibrio mesophilus TaxID=2487273 RepID=A0A4Q0I4W2_9FIRM|nr:cell division protein ZapA [Acetivibrio mesophilus]ODM28147.1 cell division protein ZapA [Clostridium sp. Bc-iso-3]RXE59353.1 cell division protein ZapA [Acetivibrio mesophilus]HHV28384.1 cell division protein ZapA [Clostridium sp.]
MAEKNKVEVRIAGKDYTLVGIESQEYIQKVALYIDRKMNEIMRINSKLSTSMASVLTAINVADDYFKAHENVISLSKELKSANEEIERLREENRRLTNENAVISNKNTNYQLELAKREAELNEVRNTLEKSTRARI